MDRHVADAMKRRMDDPARHSIRFGLVKDADHAKGLIKVEIQPEGDLTNWIRYSGPETIALGKWKASWLPPNDAEVMLLALDPDCSTYQAILTVNNEEDLPPEGSGPDRVLWVHEGGNKVLLDDDGMVYVGDKTGAHPLMMKTWIDNVWNPFITSYNAHLHPHPMGPTLVPAAPLTPWASGDVTAKCKGA